MSSKQEVARAVVEQLCSDDHVDASNIHDRTDAGLRQTVVFFSDWVLTRERRSR
jgi:hypothetical protein